MGRQKTFRTHPVGTKDVKVIGTLPDGEAEWAGEYWVQLKRGVTVLGTSPGAAVPKSIMIVDDNETVRGILRDLFVNNAEWHVCAEASNGADALEKARELRPEFVLLDFSMPSMNGLEAARRLKAISPKTAIVMLTAFKDGFLEQEAYEAGVSWVLSKSVEDVRKVVDFAGVLLSLDAPPNASGSGPRGVRRLKTA